MFAFDSPFEGDVRRRRDKSEMADLKKIGDLLILLGGILGLIEGILTVLGLLFSLIALVNSGVIKISALEFSNKWLVVLIMGVLMYLFSSTLGGALVIIGAILLLL